MTLQTTWIAERKQTRFKLPLFLKFRCFSVKENGQYIHKFIHEEWNHFRKHITIFEEKPVDLSVRDQQAV